MSSPIRNTETSHYEDYNMKKYLLLIITAITSLGFAKTFDPTKLPNEEFATIANIMGMTTVFVVLTVLALLIAFLGKVISSTEKKKEAKHSKEVIVQTIVKEPIGVVSDEDNEEITAAIFGAIYSIIGHKNFKIKSYRRSNTINTWKRLSMVKNNRNGRIRKW
jgi:sodium pump decarboxylase gamma subunit